MWTAPSTTNGGNESGIVLGEHTLESANTSQEETTLKVLCELEGTQTRSQEDGSHGRRKERQEVAKQPMQPSLVL